MLKLINDHMYGAVVALEQIWQAFLNLIKEEAGSRVVETWFKAVTLISWDAYTKIAYLKTPNTFVKDWLESNYKTLIITHLGRLFNESAIKLVILDQTNAEIQVTPAVVVQTPQVAVYTAPAQTQTKNAVTLKRPVRSSINQAYTFDTFVVGPHNSLAYAAAHAVAEKPGVLYNPLFLYGQSGLGKTHILHGIGNYIKKHTAGARVVYQSADRFVNEFIQAIRFDKIAAFESKYKELDVLLIDDIQFISNKEQTQEAFFHIFNTLYEGRKQMVVTSDSMPKDIAGLAQRLRSRLDGGLIADIHMPTLETKIAILKKKADLFQEIISDEVAHFIACRVISSVRELEGLLIRVCAFSSLTQQPVSLELAQKVLQTAVPETVSSGLDLKKIAHKIAQYYACTVIQLKSHKRHKVTTQARHVAMYLMKKLTKKPLSEIATFWGRKDHSTVVHAIDKIEACAAQDSVLMQELEKLERDLLN